MEHTVS